MKRNKKQLFSVTDPEGRLIELSGNTWQHITTGHPEISDIEEVKITIQSPNVISKNTERGSLIYSKTGRTVSYVNVVAKMDMTYSKGNVTTAFLSGKLPKGQPIWVRKGQTT